MVEKPSHVKQLSLNHVCKIGLKYTKDDPHFRDQLTTLIHLPQGYTILPYVVEGATNQIIIFSGLVFVVYFMGLLLFFFWGGGYIF
jgi:hypothetical protein